MNSGTSDNGPSKKLSGGALIYTMSRSYFKSPWERAVYNVVIEEVLHLASGPQCLKAAGKVSCWWSEMAALCSVLFMCQRSKCYQFCPEYDCICSYSIYGAVSNLRNHFFYNYNCIYRYYYNTDNLK